MKKGMFITLEGPDGSGKSTQIRYIMDFLGSRGYETVLTREPGGTAIGEKIRDVILDKENAEMDPMTETMLYAASRAQHVAQVIKPALEAGKVVIFAGGTGSPFFTTDTTAALRALETDCEAVLKATKVDGIYSADPFKDPNAVRYSSLSYEEALSKQLKVMDAAAFSLCREHDLPIVVFNFFDAGSLERVLTGDPAAGTVVR